MVGVMVPAASAGPDDPVTDDPDEVSSEHELQRRDRDPSASLMSHDAETDGIVSDGPSAKVTKNLDLRGRGLRNNAGSTTDVWALGGYAYTGTFSNPCGGDPDAGVWVWDVSNKNKTDFVGIIPSPTGSRANDVKAASMNSGDILVHSNELCAGGGRGGFEIYNIDDPANPVALASVQTDDVNAFLRDNFGYVDFGVHNLFLFTQGTNDYVGAVVESEFGNFQIFDITDPSIPVLVGFWGAESNSMGDFASPWPNEDYETLDDFGKILDVDAYLFDGFGSSQNRFLHDITISADGTAAYLASWDAGLILLDISDPTSPVQVSTSIRTPSDVENGSLDGEVNSHAVWPSEDGSIVVEGEEDFDAWEGSVAPTNFIFSFDNPVPGVATGTVVGDVFEGNQTGNSGTLSATVLDVTLGSLSGSSYPVAEIGDNALPLGAGSVSGDIVWIGQACNGDGIANPVPAGAIAVARRGACTFSEKSINAGLAGAGAIVIANNLESTEWAGLRIWDYSDPANPTLASTFNTTCSATAAPGGSCDPAGTYSVHNVIVETTGNKVKAYVSWYSDGMLVLDVSDPYHPVEVGRFLDGSTNNDEANDFWGVYKEPNSPFIYGSDRNGGLYILKEQGKGSG
jgi:hypothetical protein